MEQFDYVSSRNTSEDRARHDALTELYEADREAAYKAVALALTTYRWWGWTNISNTFRTWLTVVKLRLGFKMWPGA